jgi:hypothetical protein
MCQLNSIGNVSHGSFGSCYSFLHFWNMVLCACAVYSVHLYPGMCVDSFNLSTSFVNTALTFPYSFGHFFFFTSNLMTFGS